MISAALALGPLREEICLGEERGLISRTSTLL